MDFLGVLGVPAVSACVTCQIPFCERREIDTFQHEGIGTVKMRSRDKQRPVDPSSGAMAALSATSSSTIFSAFSRKQPQPPSDNLDILDDGDSETESLNDDGLSSESSEDDFESGPDDDDALSTLHESPALMEETVQTVYNATVGLPPPPKTKSSGDDKLSTSAPKTGGWLGAKTLKTPHRQTSLPDDVSDDFDSPGLSIPGTPGTGLTTPGGTKQSKRPIFKRAKSRAPSKKSSRRDFNLDAMDTADVQGIVVMEIQSASDLPKLKNGEV